MNHPMQFIFDQEWKSVLKREGTERERELIQARSVTIDETATYP